MTSGVGDSSGVGGGALPSGAGDGGASVVASGAEGWVSQPPGGLMRWRNRLAAGAAFQMSWL
jgi:hypothetical protein